MTIRNAGFSVRLGGQQLALLLLGVVLLVSPGCRGAQAPGLLGAGNDQLSSSQLDPKAKQSLAEARRASWDAFLENPAASGYDYHLERITVSYRPGASLPQGYPTPVLPQGKSAGDQGNTALRTYPECEALSDAIAASYNLIIRNQVYKGQTRLVGFELPEGADGAALLESIRNDFGFAIEFAAFSTRGQPDYIPNDPDFLSSDESGGLQWCIHRLGFPRAWDNTTGSLDIGIASIDSGLNLTHEEFQNTVLDPTVHFPGSNVDTINQDNTMEDLQGHGSGVSGLIAAEMDNNRTITGGSPGCSIIPIKITNDWWDVTDASMIEGLYVAFELGADILTMSFSWPPGPALEGAMNDLDSQGALLLCSAGNDDSDFANYPSAYPAVMSVGATTVTDSRISHWWGSNFHPTVEIAAPGEDYRSCQAFANIGDAAYQDFGGTSGSCPLVGACAALAWSFFPEWTNDEIRQALIETGAPTTGFPHDVPRVDIGTFFEEYTQNFSIPSNPALLNHGTLELELTVRGEYNSIEGVFSGRPFQSLSAPPWSFELDTTAVLTGSAQLVFTGYSAEDPLIRNMTLFMDNTPGVFPFHASADGAGEPLQIIDAKNATPAAMLQLLYLPNSSWSPAQAKLNGAGAWRIDTQNPYEGQGSYYCGLDDFQSYGDFEMDCLVSHRIDLQGTTDPILVFDHRYNFEDGGNGYDRGVVLISTDWGSTWDLAETNQTTLASFTGFEAEWVRTEISLADYAGSSIHIALSLQSDGSVSGENASEPSGWWVDNITVTDGIGLELASFANLQLVPAVIGLVPEIMSIEPSIEALSNVARVEYTMDFFPVGQLDPYDLVYEATGEPFGGELELPEVILPNHFAVLTASCFDSSQNPGVVRILQVPVFNLRGDVNQDNIVDELDFAAYTLGIGAQLGDVNYSVFLDSDLDGTVTEADAAAVGYAWGGSI